MLAYLTWDPSPSVFPFCLPLLHRPILWYGVLFALGFLLGYSILLYLLQRFFCSKPYLSLEDLDGPLLWRFLQSKHPEQERETLKEKIAEQLASLSVDVAQEYRENKKESLLKAVNVLIGEKFFSSCSVSKKTAKILSFFKHRVTEKELERMKEKLVIESLLSPCVATCTNQTKALAEKISLSVILGAVIGARLGDVLFYQGFQEVLADPLSIIKIWEGGLASHGGAAGIILALVILSKRQKKYSFLQLVDFVVIPTAFAACLIRVGNFFNQEILGTPSALPWAVLFGHPADGSLPVPRHPVQLYEALFYLITFAFLMAYWRYVFWFVNSYVAFYFVWTPIPFLSQSDNISSGFFINFHFFSC